MSLEDTIWSLPWPCWLDQRGADFDVALLVLPSARLGSLFGLAAVAARGNALAWSPAIWFVLWQIVGCHAKLSLRLTTVLAACSTTMG